MPAVILVYVLHITQLDRGCIIGFTQLHTTHHHTNNRNVMEVVDEHHEPQPNSYRLPPHIKQGGLPTYAISGLAQFSLQMQRNFWHSARDGRYNGVRFAYTILTALVVGLLWWNQGNKR